MRKNHPINYGWKYCPSFSEEMIKPDFDDGAFEVVDIPHANKELPLNYFDEKSYQFVSCYRKSFDLPQVKGKRYMLHFEGAAVYSRVYLNGEFIGEYKGAYNRFSFDITDTAKKKGNTLVVELDSTEHEEIPPFGNVVDYLVYGGIYREVWIEEVDETYIDNIFVRTVNVLHKRKLLDIDVTLNKKADGVMKFRLVDGDNNTIGERETSFSGTVINAKWSVENVELWDINNPNLYTIYITLDNGDELSQRFGFRECKFYRDGFHLNGRHIKIRGLNRHQSYPYVGYAMPESVQKADADLLKYTLGVNLVRTSHYPNSVHFLDRCDETGLLVFTEMPSWQFLGEGEWREHVKENVRRMVLRDRNHPSVILWGVRVNEGMDCDEIYLETNKIAHELDNTRQTGGVRNFPQSHLLEDVYTYNDFIHSGGKMALIPPIVACGPTSPYLVTEHNGHMFPTKSFDREALRTEHALRHTRVLNKAYKSTRTSGAIGWCMADYNTHKDFGSGDRICYHGVTDMFRVPKLGAAIYRSQQDTIPFLEVSSSMDIGEHPGGNLGEVWVFTNCDCVKVYKNDRYTSTLTPDKSKYPHLPHPPMIANDFIGDMLETVDNIEPKAASLLKDALVDAQMHQIKMAPQNYLKAGAAMVVGRIPFGRMFDLVTKYVGGWGEKQVTYRFEGYKNGECVATVTKTAVTDLHLDINADSLALKNGDTYDATRVEIIARDQNDNRAPFADIPIKVSISGPVKVIGPTEFSLIGGDRAFWIRTVGESGKATVTVDAGEFGVKKLKFTVA